MEVTYFGANYVVLTTKTARLAVDPSLPGQKTAIKKFDIIATTFKQDIEINEEQLLIDTPGEYEAKHISLKGISARAHMDEEPESTATMLRIDALGIRVGIIGHIYPELSNGQLESFGNVDALVIPVGGNGYTLDAIGAISIIRAVEPKVVIPTHFKDNSINYEVPQNELKLFLDELGAPVLKEDKYKMKDGTFPEQLTVVVLSRSS